MEFRILGPLEVWHEGEALPVRGAKQRALLAALLLRPNEVVSSDRLIDELWGQETPESGGAALRVRVSQLRKALEVDGATNPLVTRAPGYLLEVRPEQVDLGRFERLTDEGRRALDAGDAARAADRLREALGLWRGPALAEFAYESFAQAAAARLDELRVAAQELRIEADLALGRHAELTGELEARLNEHPLRERLHGQLMLARYRSGRQAEALDAYQEARRRLVDDLGIEPGRELQELERAILRQDPALDFAAERRPAAAEPERAILVVPKHEVVLDALVAVAEPLASAPARELILALLVADGARLATATAQLNERRAALVQRGIAARSAVFTTADPGSDLLRLVSQQETDLLLLDLPTGEEPLSPDRETVLARATCDVALLAPGKADGTLQGPVLVPFSGAEHDWAAVELAAWYARATETGIQLLGSDEDPDEGRRDASRLLAHASLAVQRGLGVGTESLLAPPGAAGVVEAAEEARLLVLGLSERWRQEGLGEARLAIAREARPPTLLVRRGLRPGGLAPRASLTRFTWSVGRAR